MVNFMIPLRAAQATLTVVVLGLTAYGKLNKATLDQVAASRDRV